jgi:hypothetical protein
MLTRADAAFDRPMILFQYIVEILHRSMSTVPLQSALGFEVCLAATVSRLAERRKSMVAPVESTARYKYTGSVASLEA